MTVNSNTHASSYSFSSSADGVLSADTDLSSIGLSDGYAKVHS